ncbi:MAG: type II toxin-antitoxin system HicB family antitoxin [Rubrobacter sp.]|nr:type II toxin-antitoxin system HicB family antitoxin [Rubrobacter sp.]
MKHLILIEPTGTGFSAYSPDLPGCVSTDATREEVERNMRDAVEFHLEGLREEGYDVPKPDTSSAYIEVEAS